jgi:hypothetical protein
MGDAQTGLERNLPMGISLLRKRFRATYVRLTNNSPIVNP